jgi:hypothetical protein
MAGASRSRAATTGGEGGGVWQLVAAGEGGWRARKAATGGDGDRRARRTQWRPAAAETGARGGAAGGSGGRGGGRSGSWRMWPATGDD